MKRTTGAAERIGALTSIALVSVLLGAVLAGWWSSSEARKARTGSAFETERAYIDDWLSDLGDPILASSYVKEEIIDRWQDQRQKYQIVSVRKPEDYSRGHIPNAINSYWASAISDETLARLDSTKTLVLYCYYGHGSMISYTILSLLGYSCNSLGFGMMDWNLDALVKQPWDRKADYPVETSVNKLKESYPLPVITSGRKNARGIVREMADTYLSSEGSPIIRSADAKAIVDDWNRKTAEYQILDVRSRRDYRKGHVPHAANIEWRKIAKIDNLRRLDPRKTVIVCSDDGQIGQLTATVLNLLGYRAVNMLFGMMDWNVAYVEPADRWDGAASYPVEYGQ